MITPTWENRLRERLAADPSVWTVAEAMTLIEEAKDRARTDRALFDWVNQEFTDVGIDWIRNRVL